MGGHVHDAFPPYPDAVERALGSEIDYQVVKANYKDDRLSGRYSPPQLETSRKRPSRATRLGVP